jgi:hypothetical protein
MSTMSLLPRWRSFGLGRDRADEAVLKERVTALQAALDKCKATAGRWTELRLGFVAAIAMVCLALGFVLGLYSGPLKQAAVDLAAAVGLASPPRNADAAFAAYQNGNYAAALQLSRPLADQGDARAQSTLGLIYYGGRGVPQDDNEAVKWFRRAADQDDVFGNFYLGVMFADGRGVPQDYPRRRSGIAWPPTWVMPNPNTISASPTPRARACRGTMSARTCGSTSLPPASRRPTSAAAARRSGTGTWWRAT